MDKDQAKEKALQLTKQARDLLEKARATGYAHSEVDDALAAIDSVLLEDDVHRVRGLEGQFVTKKGDVDRRK